MPEGLEKLTEEARKLMNLLEDPQPGMTTWMSFLAEQIDKVSAFSGTFMILTHTERLIDECEKIQTGNDHGVELRVGALQAHIGLLKLRLEMMKGEG